MFIWKLISEFTVQNTKYLFGAFHALEIGKLGTCGVLESF